MSDLNGDNHRERVFWVEYEGGLRGFSTDASGGRVLAEYIRSDVVENMVYDQHITYDVHQDLKTQ